MLTIIGLFLDYFYNNIYTYLLLLGSLSRIYPLIMGKDSTFWFGFIELAYSFVLYVLALCLVNSMLPVSLDCSFLIAPSLFSSAYRRTCTKPEKWAVMYLCFRGIHFTSLYHFDIEFWNCSDSMVFFFCSMACPLWFFSLNIFYLPIKQTKWIRHKLNKPMKSSPNYNMLQ
jgi:hypothetical protein